MFLAKPTGARFLRADLHIHSFGGSHDVKDAGMTSAAIVQTAATEGLSILAITDHNEIVNVEAASTDDCTGMREETISELVKNLSEEMVKAGEAREPFQLRDLRRTAETMLAKLGTGPNIRGEVQSHGLGGVQKRHYDQHDYLAEKRAALQLWASHLAALKARTAVGEASAPNG